MGHRPATSSIVANSLQLQLKDETGLGACLFGAIAFGKRKLLQSACTKGLAMGYSGRPARRARIYASALIIAAIFATNAAAAVLVNVEGTVSVNRGGGLQPVWGNGFQPASSGTALSSGDRVRADANGSAHVLYENGCSTRVAPSEIAVVLATPPSCHGATLSEPK